MNLQDLNPTSLEVGITTTAIATATTTITTAITTTTLTSTLTPRIALGSRRLRDRVVRCGRRAWHTRSVRAHRLLRRRPGHLRGRPGPQSRRHAARHVGGQGGGSAARRGGRTAARGGGRGGGAGGGAGEGGATAQGRGARQQVAGGCGGGGRAAAAQGAPARVVMRVVRSDGRRPGTWKLLKLWMLLVMLAVGIYFCVLESLERGSGSWKEKRRIRDNLIEWAAPRGSPPESRPARV